MFSLQITEIFNSRKPHSLNNVRSVAELAVAQPTLYKVVEKSLAVLTERLLLEQSHENFRTCVMICDAVISAAKKKIYDKEKYSARLQPMITQRLAQFMAIRIPVDNPEQKRQSTELRVIKVSQKPYRSLGWELETQKRYIIEDWKDPTINRSINRLIDWLFVRMIGRLIDWLVEWNVFNWIYFLSTAGLSKNCKQMGGQEVVSESTGAETPLRRMVSWFSGTLGFWRRHPQLVINLPPPKSRLPQKRLPLRPTPRVSQSISVHRGMLLLRYRLLVNISNKFQSYLAIFHNNSLGRVFVFRRFECSLCVVVYDRRRNWPRNARSRTVRSRPTTWHGAATGVSTGSTVAALYCYFFWHDWRVPQCASYCPSKPYFFLFLGFSFVCAT